MVLEAGKLWTRVIEQTEYALHTGALQSIPTDYEFVEQNGISFLVRTLSNLVRKDEVKKQQEDSTSAGKDFNPFLPYEEDLFVADISDTHLCLLNKYNVVDHHLLMITRDFEDQENWLNWRDFQAMWITLAEIDGLAFYNGGKIAGASQKHKHLQLVPLPLAEKVNLPIERAIATAKFTDSIGTSSIFPFVHAIALLDPSWTLDTAATATLECYQNLLHAVGLNTNQFKSDKQSGAYNLLATRQWMLVVPRLQESFESISVNSLGFAGSLFVRNDEQMQILKHYGPMRILQQVTSG
ncbi:phosphorylase [Gloeocapsopsis sp. IPPAS B-1203]|uniref:ATP adenylyltransferase family protein n=1 Tax=Gloeocapsopsis sp. IPPAS B-1203 TaxID=2049454 RepID=UPI000C17CCDA|nr:phosphorylase [Gloeocapsopsis sp. IPPAS B-1203]PIG95262.1 phosphorylase [Gloeocapsopsis sp. IPPAS B-1203]